MKSKISKLSLLPFLGVAVCTSATDINNSNQELKPIKMDEYSVTSENALGAYVVTRLQNELSKMTKERELQEKVLILSNKNADLNAIYARASEEIQERDSELESLKKELERQLSLGSIHQNYYYKTGESAIFNDQLEKLTESLSILGENPNVIIEIIGRADPRGNAEFNKKLAQKRIDFVKDIAVENGFSPERVVTKNMGEVGGKHSDKEMYFFQRYLSVEIKLK